MSYSNDSSGRILHLVLFLITIMGLAFFFQDELNERLFGVSAEAATNESAKTKNDYLLVVKYGFVLDEIESANIEKDSEVKGSYKYLSVAPTDTNSNTWVKYTPSKGNTIYEFENLTVEQYEEQKDEILNIF